MSGKILKRVGEFFDFYDGRGISGSSGRRKQLALLPEVRLPKATRGLTVMEKSILPG